jgi:hypothetical protein
VRHLTLGAVALLAGAAGVVRAERAEPAASQRARVIDQTLRCTVALDAGIRQIRISGQSGVRDQADPSKWFAIAGLHLTVDNGQLAAIQAGAPRAEQRVPQLDTTFLVGRDACRPVAARIPLSPKGLGGGPLNRFVEYYHCAMPRRIVMRVRGEFRQPVALRSDTGARFTEAPMRKGFVAIRSERGRPLLYADVVESGRARLFSRSCVRS